MFSHKKRSIPNIIVNISQPHVRPIVRGKAKANVEFGAKISASVIDSFIMYDRIEWESYNEGGDLPYQIEEYKRRYGYYPESVHAYRIYQNRANRNYCKKRNIRISGIPLGRPRKETAHNKEELKNLKMQRYQDDIDRIAIEGKFGQCKRRFGLGHIMSKL